MFVCITLLQNVSALLLSYSFISNQKTLVFICLEVCNELNNHIEIELETKFRKFRQFRQNICLPYTFVEQCPREV